MLQVQLTFIAIARRARDKQRARAMICYYDNLSAVETFYKIPKSSLSHIVLHWSVYSINLIFATHFKIKSLHSNDIALSTEPERCAMKDPNPRNGKELGSPLDHILLDYPVSNEETVSKRYTFFHDLGSGAYATVKYGTCTKTKKPFAVKIISKTKTPKDYLRKFVPREVDALKRLSIHGHPFITQMREFFETSNRVYLVTTLAKGGDLLTYINSRKYLDEEVAKKMIAQLLCALDHIHDLGIVHRDLKCENLLIGDRDQIMVTDFGFATQQPRNRLLTTFCGSYAYAAPEILTGSSYNGKCTDVWSVGVILYAMLNGRLPYNDTKPKNIMLKIKTNPLVMVKRVSLLCEKFVRGLLTISSMDRPTVSELLLHKWLEKPMEKVLKTLPENLQPSCFKLTRRSSFRMSVSSEESPPAEIVAANSSNKTSSTISERVKRKYRQVNMIVEITLRIRSAMIRNC